MKLVKFQLGERKAVRIRVWNMNNKSFLIQKPSYELWHGKTLEDTGNANIIESDENNAKIIEAVIEPKSIFTSYKLLICYTIGHEEFKTPVMIEVVK